MRVELIKIEKGIHEPCSYPESFSGKWTGGVNAKFIFNSRKRHATLVHQIAGCTSNGWPAGGHTVKAKRLGWNFCPADDLVGREPAAIVFTHLFATAMESVTLSLCITPDGKKRTMYQFATEIINQIEPQL